MEIYKCDNCNEVIQKEELISLGSSNKSLIFNNPVPSKKRSVVSLSNHNDVHFCDRVCFTDFFFKQK